MNAVISLIVSVVDVEVKPTRVIRTENVGSESAGILANEKKLTESTQLGGALVGRGTEICVLDRTVLPYNNSTNALTEFATPPVFVIVAVKPIDAALCTFGAVSVNVLVAVGNGATVALPATERLAGFVK